MSGGFVTTETSGYTACVPTDRERSAVAAQVVTVRECVNVIWQHWLVSGVSLAWLCPCCPAVVLSGRCVCAFMAI